jgi:hypothetical protein
MWRKIKNFFRNIKILIEWIPIIWGNYDWDEHYLLRILQYKISRMRKYHQNFGHLLHADKVIKDMKYAEFLLKRIMEDNYCEKESEELEQNWGELEFQRTYLPENDMYSVHIARILCKSEKDIKLERQESLRLYNKRELLLKTDIDTLFKLLAKKLRMWWD